MMQLQRSVEFLAALEQRDGYPPMSEAKMPSFRDSQAAVTVVEDDVIRAVGAIARHRQSDGTLHASIETAVDPSMRFTEFEGAVLDATLELADRNELLSVWSNRVSLDRALDQKGFVVVRTLAYLVVDLPIEMQHEGPRSSVNLRTFVPEDVPSLVKVNAEAFAGHREAASLTEADVWAMSTERWFDPRGLIIVEDGLDVVGFCWTKVHANGDGEIFRIAVSPSHQATGVGRGALEAGFVHLAERPDVVRGTLWVDTSNRRAMQLYASLGMESERTINEFESS